MSKKRETLKWIIYFLIAFSILAGVFIFDYTFKICYFTNPNQPESYITLDCWNETIQTCREALESSCGESTWEGFIKCRDSEWNRCWSGAGTRMQDLPECKENPYSRFCQQYEEEWNNKFSGCWGDIRDCELSCSKCRNSLSKEEMSCS